MRRFFLAAMLLLISAPAFAATNGVSADFSKGVLLLGSPAGAANCNAATTGAVRYNSTTPRIEFCNGTSWVGVGGMTLISTQTASGATSLSFSGTNWSSSYNTLILDCSNFTESANGGGWNITVGEGGGPTWEAGAHYIRNYISSENGSVTGTHNVGSDAGGTCGAVASGGIIALHLEIHNVSSSSVYKLMTSRWDCSEDFYSSPSGLPYTGFTQAYWSSDTNAITGLKLTEGAASTFSGTCSLYGMN